MQSHAKNNRRRVKKVLMYEAIELSYMTCFSYEGISMIKEEYFRRFLLMVHRRQGRCPRGVHHRGANIAYKITLRRFPARYKMKKINPAQSGKFGHSKCRPTPHRTAPQTRTTPHRDHVVNNNRIAVSFHIVHIVDVFKNLLSTAGR